MADPEFLKSIIDRARRILGPVFDPLRARDLRGQTTPKTPPKHRHRIMEMVDATEAALRSVEKGQQEMDVVALVELNMVLELFERWQQNPGIGRIVKEIENPDSYAHAVIVLAAASFLMDAGNAVTVVTPPASGERTPDLRITTPPGERVGVEVKAPIALQKRTSRVTSEEARKIVASCLKDAGTGPGGQLGVEGTGVLLIGGFQLSRKDVRLLMKAAAEEIRRLPRKRLHIITIAILGADVLLENFNISATHATTTNSSRANAIIVARFVHNPNYAGNVRISEKSSPLLRPIDERGIRELEWHGNPLTNK
jgi:hypothetical protein